MNMERNIQDNFPNDFEEDAITNIQRYLRHLSFHNADIPPVPLDGIYDRRTREAIVAFQRANGLRQTGVVDRETWDRLKEEYDRSVSLNSPPVQLDVFPRAPAGYSLEVGEQSYLTVIVQHMLNELEKIYRFTDLSQTGTYDEATAQNVREFQERNRIPISGRVDRQTWDALAAQYNLLDGYGEP